MALERELDTYRRELPRLLRENHRGKFVLIQGDVVDSVWPTEEEAVGAGYQRFELDPFLVKKITDQEEPYFISRNIRQCP